MGVRRAQDPADQHAGHGQVGAVQRAPRHLRHAVRTHRPGADPFEGFRVFRGDVVHGCLRRIARASVARPAGKCKRPIRNTALRSRSLSPFFRGRVGARGSIRESYACGSTPHPDPLPASAGRGSVSAVPSGHLPAFRCAKTCGSVVGLFGRAAAMLAYTAPSTVEEAVRALAGASGVAKILSGGTDLLVQLRSGRARPDLIVDIKKIADMASIRERDGTFVIGAATPGAVIGECEALRQAWPGVVEAANLIGSTQIQGRATLAGNLCNASPAADSVPALIAARATCVVAGAKGRREVPVAGIGTGPGRTSLGRGEFIVAFHLPKRPARSADAYLRFI